MDKKDETAMKRMSANPQMKPFLDLYVFTKQLMIMANDTRNGNIPPIIMADHFKHQGLSIIKEVERLTDKPGWKYRAGQQSLEVVFLAEMPESETGFDGCVSIEHFLLNGNKTEINPDLGKTVTEYLEAILFQ